MFLAIATNIPVLLMTGFVLQGHILCTHILVRIDGLKLKLVMSLFLTKSQLFTSQEGNWWTGVVRITKSISIVNKY